MNDICERCLSFAIDGRAHRPRGHRAPHFLHLRFANYNTTYKRTIRIPFQDSDTNPNRASTFEVFDTLHKGTWFCDHKHRRLY
jgi:hypothetical protein